MHHLICKRGLDPFVLNLLQNLIETGHDPAPEAKHCCATDTPKRLEPRSEYGETPDAYWIAIELPGITKEEIALDVEDRKIHLRTEKKGLATDNGEMRIHYSNRKSGLIDVTYEFPEDTLIDTLKATHANGVLTLSVTRDVPPKPETKHIEICEK